MVFFLTLEEEETNNLFEWLPACSELLGHSPVFGPLWLPMLGLQPMASLLHFLVYYVTPNTILLNLGTSVLVMTWPESLWTVPDVSSLLKMGRVAKGKRPGLT